MARRTSPRERRARHERRAAVLYIAVVAVAITAIAYFYAASVLNKKTLNKETLCPVEPVAVTVLLVDVTDPLSLPQRQDFVNQIERLIEQIPRHGKLVIAKVDPVSDRLLLPLVTRCNPGGASDVSEVNSNPRKLESMRRDQFIAPVRAAFDDLMVASGASRSPIFESIQSINLTELQHRSSIGLPRRLIVASDLMQNTDQFNFYRRLPSANEIIMSPAFQRVRTDLRDVDVELWMLQRGDAPQPRALPDLWESIIDAQGGRLMRVYNVSG